jgi:hypothetical protein
LFIILANNVPVILRANGVSDMVKVIQQAYDDEIVILAIQVLGNLSKSESHAKLVLKANENLAEILCHLLHEKHSNPSYVRVLLKALNYMCFDGMSAFIWY